MFASGGRSGGLLSLVEAAKEAGLRTWIQTGGPQQLAEQIDSQRGFTQILSAGLAATFEVFTNGCGVLRAERPQQIEFVPVF
jgi:phosphoserine phosphatase